jgi:hypothetical protein
MASSRCRERANAGCWPGWSARTGRSKCHPLDPRRHLRRRHLRARTGNLPAILTTIRNTVIAALRLAGASNIAQARRWAATQTHRVNRLFIANVDINSL